MKLLFLVVTLFIVTVEGNERYKRDNGAAFEDSGGPVAQKGKGDKKESGGVEISVQLQSYLAALDPCEKKLLPNSTTVDIKEDKITKGVPEGVSNTDTSISKPIGLGRKKRQFNFPGVSNASSSSPEEQFKEFVAHFGKKYPSDKDRDKAFENFKTNLKTLFSLLYQRRSPYDASFTISKFMDIKFDTFVTQHGGIKAPSDKDKDKDKALKVDVKLLGDLSAVKCKKMNWTTLGIVPNVRTQDKCGCCYAMSTADMIATQYSIDKKEKKSYKLSPQWISDCLKEPAAYQCDGGRPVKVLDQLIKEKTKLHIPTEKCYPYLDKNSKCSNKTCSDALNITITGTRMLDISGIHEKEVMAKLLQHGPLVAIVGVTESWQMYNGSGIMRAFQCSEKQNHAVLITGYDYSGCVPTYYIKNSWGEDWGYKGHIKLEAGKNTCAVAKSVVFACTTDKCHDDPIKHVLSSVLHPDCKK